MATYQVQAVEYVNYTALIEADSIEEAENLASEYGPHDKNSPITWIKMDGYQPFEVCEGGTLKVFEEDE